MKAQFAPITPNKPHRLFRSLEKAIEDASGTNARFKAGFAYATLGGVESLLSHVGRVGHWRGLQKQFLIGIHHGITEPSALEKLRRIDNTFVRVFVPSKKLTADSLNAKPLFHPKVMAICDGDDGNLRFFQAGSPNLTSSGVGENPSNYEFSVSVMPTRISPIDRANIFETWWANLWNKSRPVDRDFIRAYAKFRMVVIEQNPILRVATEAPPSIGSAEFFYLEVGAASGPPGRRHQVEFPESLARFFGPVERQRRDITLRHKQKSWSGRPLSYKETTFGVEIWRLGMPTQTTGGEPIAGRAIAFRRTADSNAFEFEVVNADGGRFNNWVRRANVDGHIGATHGQRARQYGFY